ncbi:MAG: HEAT repeat domain-containing protein [Deltaproteobacteria bacterium]|nr:HEAT repeat domain-containing protein [Deltaproteobacteria bacterium]
MIRLARTLGATLLVAGLLLVPPRAFAGEADGPEPGLTLDGLTIVLSMNHEDPSPADLEPFRPGLYEKLATIESDLSRPRIARIRALAAMAREDGDRTMPRVAALIDDPTAAPRLRIAAGWTLGNPLARHPEAVSTLQRLLKDRDPGLRERAVLSLSLVGTPEALKVLEQHRLVERNVVVRTALREAAAEARGLKVEQLPREGAARPAALLHRDLEATVGAEVIR